MFKETIRRIKAKTPKYFKMLRRACISMSVVSGIALTIKEDLPLFIKSIMPQILTIGLAGTFFSSLPEDETKKDTQ